MNVADAGVYYVEVAETGRTYLLDPCKYVVLVGDTASGDVQLVRNAQLHDDDSETLASYVVMTEGRMLPCFSMRVFGTDAGFREWRRI